MSDVFVLVAHLLTTFVRLLRPGGLRAVAAESLAVKQQLLVMKRTHPHAPRLKPRERLMLGLCSLLVSANRRDKMAVSLKPSTLLRFHQALVRAKYRLLYTARKRNRPGPKGPSKDLIAAVVEMKRRNPRFGYLKIAQTIADTFGIEINKDVVRRILAHHYYPDTSDGGPSWLTVIGHAKDSLWSIDFFKCESILLHSFWVLVVIDVFTRRFVGFAVEPADPDGPAVCRMLNHALAGKTLPKYLSSDHDPLFRFHRWLANLQILDIEELKAVPFTPVSHPFVERLIGTVRREFLDQILFWNRRDLERKLADFQSYYNRYRVHSAIEGTTPPCVCQR